jgi:hypothetical protein
MSQKLLVPESRVPQQKAQRIKSFLLLFFKKEVLAFPSPDYPCGAGLVPMS